MPDRRLDPDSRERIDVLSAWVHREVRRIFMALVLFGAGMTVVAFLLVSQAGDISTSRKQSINAVCVVQSAIIQSGVSTILGGATLPGDRVVGNRVVPGELSRFLDRHGFPPPNLRLRQARVSAGLYAQRIASALDHQGIHRVVDTGTGRVRCVSLSKQLAP